MQAYQHSRRASFASWHPTRREMLISTRFGDTTQAHYLSEPGGARRQLTFFPERVSPTAMHRGADESFFLFSMDVGGSEFYQYYRFDLSDGRHHLLTDGKSRNSGLLLNHRGDRFIYSSTKRNGRDSDLYVANPVDPADETLVVEASGTFYAAAWSPDDAKVAVVRYISANQTDAFVLDVASKKLDPIRIGGAEKAYIEPAAFRADGRALYLISDHGGEFRQLYEYELSSGAATLLTASISWNVEQAALFARRPDAGFLRKRGRRQPGSAARQRVAPFTRVAAAASRRGRRAGVSSPTQRVRRHDLFKELARRCLYSYDLDAERATRWTYSETGGADLSALPDPELIHYPTFDEVDGKPRMIPAFVWKPAPKFDGPLPVLIDIHGGPEGQVRPSFPRSSTLYLLNELGVTVIQPNVRGSAGYGKSYLLLDNGVKREDSVKDIGALLDWIGTNDDFDSARVAVIGGSYGGYMSLASMTHFSDRLRCGVEIVGISHFGNISAQHPGLPPPLTAGGVRRRERSEDVGLLRDDLAAQQRRQNPGSDAGGAGQERPARALHRIRADRGRRSGRRRRGLVHAGERRGTRLREEAESRLLRLRDDAIPGTLSAAVARRRGLPARGSDQKFLCGQQAAEAPASLCYDA